MRPQLDDVRFRCPGCLEQFTCAPGRVEDCEADSWHPWRYFCACPVCGTEATQDPGERALLKAWASATGPRTDEGRARISEAAAQRDPSSYERTRFNALKHGINAKVATFYPARPGKYAQCHGCEYLMRCAIDFDACMKRAELFLKHHVAFETKNPALLTSINAELHANIRAMIDDMILTVIGDGSSLRVPEWYIDKDGRFQLARYVDDKTGEQRQLMKIEAHPLIKNIREFVQGLGMTLSDLGMTPKVQEQEASARGNLASTQASQTDLMDYQRRQTVALEALSGLIGVAKTAAAQDPVLLEYQRGQGDG